MTTPETNPETTPEMPAAPETPAAPAAAVAPAAKKARNTLGLVALGLAVLGALLAVIPATNGFSWVILLGAFIVSIVALTRKGQGKTMALIALIVSFLFWIISIFVGIAVVATAVSESLDDAPSISAPDTADADADAGTDAEPAAAAGIGDTITTDDGVEITLLSITPNATSPDDYFASEVRGSLVAVSMSMVNGTNEAVTISGGSVNGFIGEAEYEAARIYGTESGDWYALEEINPGLTAAFTAYIDIPADATLDSVSYTTELFFGDGVMFLAK
ncbi:hypothetical protein [Salinibacterium sp. SWN1162]|uniref:hypothetical protein n=1 Tax=Salinibacterium sp. SWN1162 TaxID=2792053 RepID=UPI0018CF2886|nr:hypothetical protein [Salinibacterium sp. SWN1162]MBH0008918.1 hypothetical protein [Salinibacterium sp. SWN1162]